MKNRSKKRDCCNFGTVIHIQYANKLMNTFILHANMFDDVPYNAGMVSGAMKDEMAKIAITPY